MQSTLSNAITSFFRSFTFDFIGSFILDALGGADHPVDLRTDGADPGPVRTMLKIAIGGGMMLDFRRSLRFLLGIGENGADQCGQAL